MFFNAEQTEGAIGSTVSTPGVSAKDQPSPHLNQQQFGKKAGPAEGGEAAEAGAGAGEAAGGAAAGGAELAELAPLLLI